jgi:hypothetical protein
MRVTYLDSTINERFPNFKRKMTYLGSGFYSSVYTDGKYAYKLCHFKSNYVAWLFDLRKNKLFDNPYVPKVYHIYVDKHERKCLVKMELLKEGPDGDMDEKSFKFELGILNYMTDSPKKMGKSLRNKVLRHIADFIRARRDARRRICLDMHGGNVMMRQKQIVITDPVA